MPDFTTSPSNNPEDDRWHFSSVMRRQLETIFRLKPFSTQELSLLVAWVKECVETRNDWVYHPRESCSPKDFWNEFEITLRKPKTTCVSQKLKSLFDTSLNVRLDGDQAQKFFRRFEERIQVVFD